MPAKKAKTPVASKKSKKKSSTPVTSETIQVKGEELIKKVKELIKEGNVRKMTILDKDGHVLISLPLTIGVVGVVLAPVLAAVGAIAALVTDCTIKVERK
jgi:hypothetical protein